jgi:hypothetical protein
MLLSLIFLGLGSADGQKKISELPNFTPTLVDYVVAVDSSGGITGKLYFSQIKTLLTPTSSELSGVISGGGSVPYAFPGALSVTGNVSAAGLASFGTASSAEGQARWYTSENSNYVQLVSAIQPFSRNVWIPNWARLSDTLATLYDVRGAAAAAHTHDALTDILNFNDEVANSIQAGGGIALAQATDGDLIISSTYGQFYQEVINGAITYPQRSRLRFQSGTNATVAANDDEGGDATVITISSTGGGSGSMTGAEIIAAINGEPTVSWLSPHQVDDFALRSDGINPTYIVSAANTTRLIYLPNVTDTLMNVARWKAQLFGQPYDATGLSAGDFLMYNGSSWVVRDTSGMGGGGGVEYDAGVGIDSALLAAGVIAVDSTAYMRNLSTDGYYTKNSGDTALVSGAIKDTTRGGTPTVQINKPLYLPYGFEGEVVMNPGTQFSRLARFVTADSMAWVAIANTAQNSFLSADGDTLYLAEYGGPGGASDGQNADSIAGFLVKTPLPSTFSYYSLVWVPDSSKWIPMWSPGFDSTGSGTAVFYNPTTHTMYRGTATADSATFATMFWVSNNTNQFDTTWFDGAAAGWAFMTNVPDDANTHRIIVEALEGTDEIILDVKGELVTTGEIQENGKDVVTFGQVLPDSMSWTRHISFDIDSSAIVNGNYSLGRLPSKYIIDSVVAVCYAPDTSPSLTYQITHGLNRDGSGSPANLWSSAQTVTSETTGDKGSVTYNDNTVTSGEWLWVTFPTVTTRPRVLELTMYYRAGR